MSDSIPREIETMMWKRYVKSKNRRIRSALQVIAAFNDMGGWFLVLRGEKYKYSVMSLDVFTKVYRSRVS